MGHILLLLGCAVVIYLACEWFINAVEWLGARLQIGSVAVGSVLAAVGTALPESVSPVVTALLLSPIATELPEVMNAIIWVRPRKTRLALANISGAMMIQATVPSGIGLLGTPWQFDTPLILAGTATLAAVIYLLALFRTNRIRPLTLTFASLFYVAFAVALAITLT